MATSPLEHEELRQIESLTGQATEEADVTEVPIVVADVERIRRAPRATAVDDGGPDGSGPRLARTKRR